MKLVYSKLTRISGNWFNGNSLGPEKENKKVGSGVSSIGNYNSFVAASSLYTFSASSSLRVEKETSTSVLPLRVTGREKRLNSLLKTFNMRKNCW